MWCLTLLPFALQALAMLFDEWYFHVRRGLPRWERIGHPIDTLSVLSCFVWILLAPFSGGALAIYCMLAIFSSLLVTKDEFVHKHHCPAAENWLHAVLFTLHPIVLTLAGFMWPGLQGIEVAPWITRWTPPLLVAHLFLQLQLGAMTLFFIYQIVYWNFIWRPRDQ